MLKQKLELTWIGKDKQPVLEPRILIEDPEKSYGDKTAENMLIFGDNLLALKALEQDFAGKIKCVYIDPPFNTGSAFDNYDDGLEHSIWLDLLHSRITIVKNLISNDGSIMIHLDDNESDYCKVILDEIFGRNNFINRITTVRLKFSKSL
jgi:adenine-specific DNA-methyltransferase